MHQTGTSFQTGPDKDQDYENEIIAKLYQQLKRFMLCRLYS